MKIHTFLALHLSTSCFSSKDKSTPFPGAFSEGALQRAVNPRARTPGSRRHPWAPGDTSIRQLWPGAAEGPGRAAQCDGSLCASRWGGAAQRAEGPYFWVCLGGCPQACQSFGGLSGTNRQRKGGLLPAPAVELLGPAWGLG